jgi:modulator of FtsH protease
MMDAIAASWANFFVAELAATASLTGLIIVAVSINLQRILTFPQLPGRAAEMLIMLVGALLVCSFALLPGQSMRLFGAEILGTGLLMTLSPVVIQARTVSIIKTQPLTWWLWRHLIGLCSGAPVLIGGCYLVAGASGGLYWIAAGVMVTLAATVWSAWVLLVEILR